MDMLKMDFSVGSTFRNAFTVFLFTYIARFSVFTQMLIDEHHGSYSYWIEWLGNIAILVSCN